MQQQFDKLNLHVIELPIAFVDDQPVYEGYLRELPFIAAETSSKQQLYRQLLEKYQAYAETQLAKQAEEEEQEEMTSSLLDYADLLKYYDGETFDGFEWQSDSNEK